MVLEPYKILHLFPSGYPGGSELCAMETIRSLKEHYEVENFAIFPCQGSIVSKCLPYIRNHQILGYDWWMSNPTWNMLLKLKMLKGFWSSSIQISKYIQSNGINKVITHSLVIPQGAIAAKLAGVEHYWYLHEYGDVDHGLKFNYGHRFHLWVIKHFSKKVIVNSKALEHHFSRDIPSETICQIYYAVDYPELKAKEKIADSLSISMVGRIAPGKNQLIALNAMALLKKRNIKTTITFVGGRDELYYQFLLQYCRTNQLESNVTFISYTPKPWEYIEQSDCVLVCSKNEAFGRVTIEGMKAGKVVVASKTGAGSELISPGVNGYLFSPDDAEELANILENIFHSSCLTEIENNAKQFADYNFSIKRHASAIYELLNA